MKRSTRAKCATALFTCISGLALAPLAQAMDNGTLLTGAQVPDWVVGNFSCAGTLITPRVAITAGHCTEGDSTYGFYHRKTGTAYYGKAITYPEISGPIGDVGLLLTDANFGGSTDIQTAAIASYAEERKALVTTGGEPVRSGTRLVVYGKDSIGKNFATTARAADTYRDYDSLQWNPNFKPDTYKLFYIDVPWFRANGERNAWRLEGYGMAIFNYSLADLLYGEPPTGWGYSDVDTNDLVVLTAPTDQDLGPARSPILAGDSGGGIFFQHPDGRPRLIGAVSDTFTHTRLSSYWPWVVKNLVEQGLRTDAILLSQKVLGTGEWGTNDRKAEVGQIFVYDNPYNGDIEYFRLASLGSDGRYWYFPTDRRDNAFWEYLGTKLPDIEQATAPFGQWQWGDRHATAGQVFIYNNPYTREVEYFRANATGTYWYFPINKTSNADWTYLGTDLPTRPLKFAARLQ